MANNYFKGSICLTDIPKELIKSYQCKDGNIRKYLDIAVMPRREPKVIQTENGEMRKTHYITCAPPKDKQVDGQNYFLGEMEERTFGNPSQPVSAVPQSNHDDLPF